MALSGECSVGDVSDLIEDGFDTSPAWFFGLVAECGGAVVGHALCSRAYSSWTRRAFYIEDLYVRPAARRRGVGLLLLQELCRVRARARTALACEVVADCNGRCVLQMAVEEGVHRVDWHVLEDNTPALGFYSRLGARDLRVTEGRAAMRLDRPHIERLAQNQP